MTISPIGNLVESQLPSVASPRTKETPHKASPPYFRVLLFHRLYEKLVFFGFLLPRTMRGSWSSEMVWIRLNRLGQILNPEQRQLSAVSPLQYTSSRKGQRGAISVERGVTIGRRT